MKTLHVADKFYNTSICYVTIHFGLKRCRKMYSSFKCVQEDTFKAGMEKRIVTEKGRFYKVMPPFIVISKGAFVK